MAVKKIPTQVYARVVGYVRPTSSYNKGKSQEWKERKLINLKNVDKVES